jgi:uncharacterized integral membrane protein (TIGR00698 family)
MMDRAQSLKKLALPAAALLCLWPAVGAATALALGFCVTFLCGNAYADFTRRHTPALLAWSVAGLGAGMNLEAVLRTGAKGIGYTAASIAACLCLGLALGRLLKSSRESSLLITVGTAICGGSAIAAVAPVMRAQPHNMSAALATVFCLNAIALFIFPPIGHAAGLSETQFGLWAALAIHDTSSVVGAGMKYGQEALHVATTVKLARALWIVPLVMLIQMFYKTPAAPESAPTPKRKYPWFILWFLLAAAAVTWLPALAPAGAAVDAVARRLLVLALFLIGANLTPDTLRAVGVKPLLQGVILWIVVAAGSLLAIRSGWIS